MKKKHMIALGITIVLMVLFFPLAFFDISVDNYLMNLIGFVVLAVGAVAVILFGSTDPSESGGDH